MVHATLIHRAQMALVAAVTASVVTRPPNVAQDALPIATPRLSVASMANLVNKIARWTSAAPNLGGLYQLLVRLASQRCVADLH